MIFGFHFVHLLVSFYFKVLTTEDWNEVLFNSMNSVGDWSFLYFLLLITIGNYILLNLLVAILVDGVAKQGIKVREIVILV